MIALRSALNITFNKYAKKYSHTGYTGIEVARNMLRNNHINEVSVGYVEGHLTDYYDSNSKTVYLSESVANSTSLSAIAVAAHEIGHAIQHTKGNKLFRFHNKLSYVVSIGSKFTRFFIYIGFLFGQEDMLTIGIALFFTTLLYQLISLPLEADASKLGYKEIKENNYLPDNQLRYVHKVLFSAFLTYIYIVIYTPINTLRLFPK